MIGVVGGLRRIGRDLARRRHLDAYVVAAFALVLAVLSLDGDLVSDDVRWSVVLAALGLLVFRVTLPESAGDVETVLRSRVAFDDVSLASRLRSAHTVCIFGPSAVNVLTPQTVDQLRSSVLAQRDGSVRIAVLDPSAADVLAMAAEQLDDAVDYPIQTLPDALDRTVVLLRSMATWKVAGRFEHRFARYNPGFSLVAVDPHEKHGVLIVEFHGFHNESVASRMHIELRRRDSEHWYEYWLDQFESLWTTSSAPEG